MFDSKPRHFSTVHVNTSEYIDSRKTGERTMTVTKTDTYT